MKVNRDPIHVYIYIYNDNESDPVFLVVFQQKVDSHLEPPGNVLNGRCEARILQATGDPQETGVFSPRLFGTFETHRYTLPTEIREKVCPTIKSAWKTFSKPGMKLFPGRCYLGISEL